MKNGYTELSKSPFLSLEIHNSGGLDKNKSIIMEYPQSSNQNNYFILDDENSSIVKDDYIIIPKNKESVKEPFSRKLTKIRMGLVEAQVMKPRRNKWIYEGTDSRDLYNRHYPHLHEKGWNGTNQTKNIENLFRPRKINSFQSVKAIRMMLFVRELVLSVMVVVL